MIHREELYSFYNCEIGNSLISANNIFGIFTIISIYNFTDSDVSKPNNK